MQDLTFYLANTPPLPVPRLDVDIRTLYCRPIEVLSREYAPSSGATPRCWHKNVILQTDRSCRSALATDSVVPRAPETRWWRSTDRGWLQRRQRRFPSIPRVCPFNVLLLIDTTREHASIDGKFLSCSMDTGFVLVLPRGPWTWQCRSFDENHFGRMAMVGGPIRKIEIPVQELWLKM